MQSAVHLASARSRILDWREGYIVLHEKTLGDALSEFNRYNAEKAIVTDPELAAIKIGGSFRVRSIDAFVYLLAQDLPVRVIKKGDELVLERE